MSSVWLGNQQNIYLNSFCFGYRQNGTFDTKYLAYVLRSRSIRNRMKVLAQGISRFNISQRRVMDIEVSFPSMDEQQKIGVLCGKLDQLIDAEKRKLDLLKKKKTTLLRQIFDQKLRFKRYNNPWEQRRLGSLFVQANERNANQELSFEKTISVASMRFNPRGNGAAHSSLSSYKILRRGDIAFEGNRHRAHPFGQLVINDIGDGLMSSRFQSIRPKAPCVIPFWKYLLQNERGMRHLLIRSTKSGTLMNEFVFDDFSRQSIPLPEEREQEKIGTLFKLLDSIIAAETRKIDLLTLKKKALLRQMFI
ncbi:restriction endonuclease subunit S [Bifidobacterium pseudolongum subsp. pseudolongum]|nr:restriction endonuclease subunit S [Bifidobacterium pseudolongum subsp. pseudolongum]